MSPVTTDGWGRVSLLNEEESKTLALVEKLYQTPAHAVAGLAVLLGKMLRAAPERARPHLVTAVSATVREVALLNKVVP